MKKIIFSLAALLIVIFTTLFAIEFVYFAYRWVVKNDPLAGRNQINLKVSNLCIPDREIGYILKPGASTADLPGWAQKRAEYGRRFATLGFRISTNAAGYRGKLYPQDKAGGVIRIVTLGGSTTWGSFNDDGTTWPDYLQEILQASSAGKIEVINGAVGGYISKQNLQLFRRKWRLYKPDIVLIACWFNDSYMDSPYFSGYPTAAADNRPNNPRTLNYPFRGGRTLIYKITSFLNRLGYSKEHKQGLVNPTKGFFAKYYVPDKIWLQDHLANISEIMRLAKEANPQAEAYVVAMPSLFVPDSPAGFAEKLELPPYDIKMYNRSYLATDPSSRFMFTMYYYHTILFQEAMEKEAKQRGYRVILGYSGLGKVPFSQRNNYFCDEIHLTAAGNRLLAGDIAFGLLASSKALNKR
jgi:lysophospholipase L1-like esterase